MIVTIVLDGPEHEVQRITNAMGREIERMESEAAYWDFNRFRIGASFPPGGYIRTTGTITYGKQKRRKK